MVGRRCHSCRFRACAVEALPDRRRLAPLGLYGGSSMSFVSVPRLCSRSTSGSPPTCPTGSIWWVVDVIRVGSAPVQSKHFRIAADLPHWVYTVGRRCHSCRFRACAVEALPDRRRLAPLGLYG